MKKYIFGLLLALSSTTSFSQIASSDLSKDENFIDYVTGFNSIVDHIATNFNRSMFAGIQTEIDNVKKQNLSKSEELVAVSKILRFLHDCNNKFIFKFAF